MRTAVGDPLLLAPSVPKIILERTGTIRRNVDVLCASRNEVGNDAAGRRAAAQPDVAVAEREIDVGEKRRRAYHR